MIADRLIKRYRGIIEMGCEMPKRAVELTDRQVKAMKARGLYAVGGVPGLHLQITGTEGRSWVYRFQLGGKRRDMGLGGTEDYTLAEARERAREVRRMVLAGVDPIEKRRAERVAKAVDKAKALTFKACAGAYIAAHQATWRNAKHRQQWENSLRNYVYPMIGELPVDAVDTTLVTQVLERDQFWHAKPETASRVRQRIEVVLDWATARRYRQGENPARWKGHLESLLPAPAKAKRAARNGRDEHHAALDYREMGAFMSELRQQEGVAARCFMRRRVVLAASSPIGLPTP
jgi:hypothetical protein